VHRGVVHEVPDQAANNSVSAFVHLGGFDDLLLHGAQLAPNAHETGVLDPVRTSNEACIIRSQGSCEHACTPRPVHVRNFKWLAEKVCGDVPEDQLVNLVDVLASDDRHLLARIGDLWNRWDGPFIRLLAWLFHAGVVAVADCEDTWITLLIGTPGLALASLHTKVHVHEDPATSSWALLTQRLLGHEVVGGLHTDANILLVRSIGQFDFLPELRALGVILGGIELLDANMFM